MATTRRDVRTALVLVFALLIAFVQHPPGAVATTADGVSVVVDAASVDLAAEAVAEVGGTVETELPIVGGVAAELPADAAAALSARDDLTVVDDAPMGFTASDLATAEAEEGSGSKQLAALNPGDDWSTETGAGVGVALIDTGVAETPALEGRVVHGPDYSGEADGVDRYGHGTFMAGLIAGNGDAVEGGYSGVAPGAHIVSLKLAGRDGETSLSRVLDAIGWVVVNRDEYGIRVLNLSIGVPTNRAPQADPLSAAVQAAWASGITVVAASGNEGEGVVTSPGRDPWVITVGATDTNGTAHTADDTVPDWSGSGRVTNNHKAELLAPGMDVVSLRAPDSAIDEEYPDARIGEDHFRGSGTSMSTALVSGAVAALAEFRPYATPDDLKGSLVRTGAEIAGTPARAVDLAAADAAEADLDWRQDHHLATRAVSPGAKGKMPWSEPGAPAPEETWQRSSWADGEWQRSSWADVEFTRSSWAGMSWADVDLTRSSWARSSWAEANFARSSWADAHFTRSSWARSSWARSSWAGEAWTRSSWARSSWAGDQWSRVGWGEPTWDGPEGS